MKNAGLTIRVNKILKEEFENFCKKSGVTVSAAINQLAYASVKEKKIPFTIKMVEFDKKIKENNDGEENVRIMIRINDESKASFSEVCREVGMPMSMIIKIFMLQCVADGKYPF